MTLLRRHVSFGAGTLLLAALNAGTIQKLIALSRDNMTASHVVLIPFVTLALILVRRAEIFGVARWSLRTTTVAALAAVLAWVASRAWMLAAPVDALSASMAGIITAWISLFAIVYGPAAFRAALYPLLFALFTVPIPQAVLAPVTLLLKRGSADIVARLFTLIGTPYHRDVFVFALPKFTIEIADACSGIRSSIALLFTALLAGHLFLETTWKKALLVAVVVPLAIVKNAIRIVTLCLLGTYVDTGYIDGALHHEGGIVFFLMMLAVLFPILIVLQRSERARRPEASWT